MSPAADAFLRSWPLAPWLYLGLLLPAFVYLRGWRALHRRDPTTWHGGKLAAFLAGLAMLFLALGSPIEPFGSLLLQVHMIQHLLLMMVAPPLLWLGTPMLPMIRGVPRVVRVYWLTPILRSHAVRRFFSRLSHPAPALACYVLMTWLWHSPGIYEAALRSGWWHKLQHLCFLGSSLLFWYPVVRPYPSRPRWSTWLLVPYLLVADVSNTVLSALLTFSDRLVYPYYGQIPRIAHIAALDDQATAGVIMWVPGSVAFLFPLFGIGIRLLFGEGQAVRRGLRRPNVASLPVVIRHETPPRFDVLRLPVLGPFLRWRHARLAFQLVSTCLAGVLIADGLSGTQVPALNLAGVLPWIHWRGFVVLALLAAGNVSCMACPFLVPRTLARRWLPARLRWPRALRSKWPSVILLLLFFWSYEAFSLWDSPWWTACIIIGYFVMATVVDGLFRGASFCKHLCPIGQFNFVQSVVSPLEVKVRDAGTCLTCRTKDCIRGTEAGLPGCELGLYLPNKAGNLDCTFCLDCVHACPHDNVGVLAAAPGRDLWNEARHSGIGRLADRPDLAALILVLVFGGFVNAAGMVAPVVAWQDAVALRLGLRSPLAVTTVCYLLALVVLPVLSVGLATVLSQRWGGGDASPLETATRFSYTLVPLGFGMWLSHYGYHLLTSYRAALPAVQRFAARLGWGLLGTPDWGDACCRPVAPWLPRLEIVCLDLGLLLALYSGYRIALARTPHAGKAFAPWAALIVLLFAAGVWIVLQPMQMRGMLARAG
ncbi:MAG: cytochrome c oxidase assembly protein [Isosphaeraceae bacterium]|nr:cytochrome c oxidase assembly protein [Isosphaeraceae bacterium]